MRTKFIKQTRTLLTTFLLLSLMLPTMTRTAQAADGGYAYHWLLKFDFENGATGQLIVDVGFNDNGAVQNPTLHSHTFPVTCQRVGAVSVTAGVAKFNGGYLQCELDVKTAIQRTFAECDALYPGCGMVINDVETYRSLAVMADVASPFNTVAPVFAHPSVSFGTQSFSAQVAMKTQLNPIGAIDSLPVVASPTTLQSYIARWGCTPAGDCGTHFNVAASPSYVDTIDTPMGFAMPSNTIYIGHDFMGSTIAAGSTIDNVVVDPGNGLPG